MINPTESLAFSMQANPGVYAVLVGSGVSRAAKIPTGWEITLDLVRKLAALRKENCDPDPERWYLNTFNKEANYLDLLDALCGTPAERQQLLRDYFEPSADDRDEGTKQPTAAHKAIAALAAMGFIRVILTTNFDRLIETALEGAGLKPAVLITPDQLHGALPLIHTRCCVIKLHGDYLDTRIRNTQAELDSYPAEFNRLLDRILDEFGLVVCGWSAAKCSARVEEDQAGLAGVELRDGSGRVDPPPLASCDSSGAVEPRGIAFPDLSAARSSGLCAAGLDSRYPPRS